LISFLDGTIEYISPTTVILNVNNIGYEINISSSTYDKLSKLKGNVRLYIVETAGMFGGTISLYGFLTQEEKDIFMVFKDGLKNTGSKKALDYLDKVMKSLPDFHKAVINKDIKLLTSIFGFHRKTAEKIVALLQDKLSVLKISGKPKWATVIDQNIPAEVIEALVALGYKETRARNVVEKIISELDQIPKTEELIKLALKYM
jgi:Holliday junction DNA helicase RuvA